MLTETLSKPASYKACPQCNAVVVRLLFDPKQDSEFLAEGGFDPRRPVYHCSSSDCGWTGQTTSRPVRGELTLLW